MGAFNKTLGFLPDVDPTTPGVITACDGFIPSKFGMKSAYSAVSTGADALAAACKGFAAVRKTDGTTRIIAGTASKLYELSSTTWNDVSRASGGNYSVSSSLWRFGQFGDITFAVNQFDTPQTSSSGAFANLSAMPKCRVLDTANQFLLIGATNEGTFGDQPDRWWCCAIGNTSDWTPAVATQCVTGRLTDAPGEITALRTLNEFVVIYKQRALYVGTYQGPPVVWGWRLVSQDIGAWSQEAVVKAGNVHYFVGYEDFFVFDGTVPVPIGDGIRDWFFNDLDRTYANNITGFYDRINLLVYWFYPSNGSAGVIDSWVAFQPSTRRWGAGTLTIEAAGEYLSATPTYDTFGVGLTYDTLPDVGYDSNYWGTSSPLPAVINGSHQLATLSGVSGSGSLTFGWNGDDETVTLVRRVSPRWKDVPDSATLVHTYTNVLGDTTTSDSAVTMSSGRFDFMRAASWHQEQISTVGNCELSGLNIDGAPAGTR